MPSYTSQKLAKYTAPADKRRRYSGHATLKNIKASALLPYRKAVASVLSNAYSRKKDFYTVLLLTEMESLLSSLPMVRQNSTRGHDANLRAKYILGHIYRQRQLRRAYAGLPVRTPKSYKHRAAFKVLEHALAVECFYQWPMNATTSYKQHQVSRQVYKLLNADKTILFGQVKRNKIRMQGLAVARHIYKMISPIYAMWLKDHRAEIQSSRFVTAALLSGQLSTI